ncbi:MAG: DUF3526 domain-containing protein [Planctomycetota bacterium]
MTHRTYSTTRATFCNELRLLIRDPLCVLLLMFFSIGLGWASWSSQGLWRGFANRQVEFQSAEREAWLSQSTENAHMATHVGQTVFKPISPLAGFDPGAVSDFGSTVFLQSHYQSAAANEPGRDETSLDQNEAYSPAVLLQLIGPLLIIILGTVSIAREKEGGTQSLLLTTGASWHAIVIGKGLAVLVTVLIVATPGLLLFAVPWFDRNSVLPSVDLIVRETVIFIMLTAYYVGWIGLTMLVTVKSSSTTGSFSLLVALWSVIALVMPRVAGDAATYVSPLPTNEEIRLEKEAAVHDANQSSIDIAEANEALEQRLLEEFEVDRIEDLPIDIAGARMIDQEASTNRLYDEVDKRVQRATGQQNKIIDGFQIVSPYLAMRAVSSSFSATDRVHHLDFVESAEDYRRQFVEALNVAEMEKRKPGDTPEERRRFWDRIPGFIPDFVSALEDTKRSMVAMICICVWAVTLCAASLFASPKIR